MSFRAGLLIGGLGVAVVALAVAVVVLATGSGNEHSETTIVKVPSPIAGEASGRDPIVLGGEEYAEPYGKGWGEERPGAVSNGGASASGEMTDISWDSWGRSVALGRGRLPLPKPTGGYYPEAVFVRIKASETGSCEGKRAYLQFSIRFPERPGGPLGSWQPWAGSANVCESPTAANANDDFEPSPEPEASPEQEVIEDAALQGVDCGKLAAICIVTVKISADGEWAALFRGPKPGHESEVQPDTSSFHKIEGYWQTFQIGNGGGCEVPANIVKELGLDCH